MFGNCDSKTNGELLFLNTIKPYINVIFDVGTRSDSLMTDSSCIVHYFEPVKKFIDELSQYKNNNKESYFNNFGLGDESKLLYYYPRYESFYNRIKSCGENDDNNKVLMSIEKAKDYMIQKNINTVDFLKIDTEGFELNVLKGFEEYLEKVNIIQTEYGGTFLDNNTKLIDVVNYLEQRGFHKFSYLTNNGLVPLTDYNDHYQYCNIICINKNSNIIQC